MRPMISTPMTVPLKVDIMTNLQFIPAGTLVLVEGYWDVLTGSSWMTSRGNPAALVYSARSDDLPFDNDVVYIKHDGLGSLAHITELEL